MAAHTEIEGTSQGDDSAMMPIRMPCAILSRVRSLWCAVAAASGGPVGVRRNVQPRYVVARVFDSEVEIIEEMVDVAKR